MTDSDPARAIKVNAWSCAVCQGKNWPHASICCYCKVPRHGGKQDAPLEWASYLLVVPAALLGLLISIRLGAGLMLLLAGVLLGWWLGLACVAMQQAWGFFVYERCLIERYREQGKIMHSTCLLTLLLRLLYWPIFVPKLAYLIMLCLFGIGFYAWQAGQGIRWH